MYLLLLIPQKINIPGKISCTLMLIKQGDYFFADPISAQWDHKQRGALLDVRVPAGGDQE